MDDDKPAPASRHRSTLRANNQKPVRKRWVRIESGCRKRPAGRQRQHGKKKGSNERDPCGVLAQTGRKGQGESRPLGCPPKCHRTCSVARTIAPGTSDLGPAGSARGVPFATADPGRSLTGRKFRSVGTLLSSTGHVRGFLQTREFTEVVTGRQQLVRSPERCHLAIFKDNDPVHRTQSAEPV